VLDTFVATVRQSPMYAPLFESADPLAVAFAERIGQLDAETNEKCTFGLVVQRSDGGFWVAEARDADCGMACVVPCMCDVVVRAVR
jgi:hypothetical protein